jgi:quinolinate synthase
MTQHDRPVAIDVTLPDHRIPRELVPRPAVETLDDAERASLVQRIERSLIRHDAVLIAHCYVDPMLQDLAETTGGHVGDSLDMAGFGQRHSASTLIVAGVRFMAETAKILSPAKRVCMVAPAADCSLDMGCRASEVVAQADFVGSTSQMVAAVARLPQREFIVATSAGLLHRLRKHHPDRRFELAPTVAAGACAGRCPWMTMNGVRQLAECLDDPRLTATNEVILDPDTMTRAEIPLRRMMAFAA